VGLEVLSISSMSDGKIVAPLKPLSLSPTIELSWGIKSFIEA
jgi:hypothetical protein